MESTRSIPVRLYISRASTLILACVLFAAAAGGRSDTSSFNGKKTNLFLLQGLTAEIVTDVLARTGIRSTDTLIVAFTPSQDGWISQTAVLASLKQNGCTVFLNNEPSARGNYLLDFSQARMQVRYEDCSCSGLFGTRSVRRIATGSLAVRAVRQASGEVLLSDILSRSRQDTVSIADIPDLELPSAEATHATVPEGNPLDRFVEPFVIIGATGLAVYLLFHVRS